MPSFPLSLPATAGFASATFRPSSVVEANVSPYSGEQQLYVHRGAWWEADLVLPPLQGRDAALWRAFLTQLNGAEGTFLMGDPGYLQPRGVATGAPQVNGAGQTGATLNAANFNPSITGILLAGDYIQLGSAATARLYMVTADANSDAFGACALSIWPPLRTAPANGAVITLENPRTVMRLTSNQREWAVQPGRLHSLRFSAREAL